MSILAMVVQGNNPDIVAIHEIVVKKIHKTKP